MPEERRPSDRVPGEAKQVDFLRWAEGANALRDLPNELHRLVDGED